MKVHLVLITMVKILCLPWFLAYKLGSYLHSEYLYLYWYNRGIYVETGKIMVCVFFMWLITPPCLVLYKWLGKKLSHLHPLDDV